MQHLQVRDRALAERMVHPDSDVMFAGILAGEHPGEVWVDDMSEPKLAFVWSYGLGSFYMTGRDEDRFIARSFNSFLESEIMPFLKKQDVHWIELSADREELYASLQQALRNRELHQDWQFVYKEQPFIAGETMGTGKLAIPSQYRVAEMNREFIHAVTEGKIGNADFLLGYMLPFWGTMEQYLAKGWGYAVLTERQEIASIAVSTVQYGGYHNIGVETLEPYRRQGLSGGLVQLLLQKYRRHGIQPWWDCMEENTASQRTAERAGLSLAFRYKLLWFRFCP
ncbi:GNAT family N-acetyltransferase [Paenibacillus apiarius]|uniref:GNAT family N-acetyltransferase n=1 Tax=Paenibacillus apiarius TaxID=46240 RepID=A0ABT4DLS8_9BACL|nr:GNAT family N-acetyltransferase [Paenibacillus apiarius]MCY9513743.1 GNAT family N-acetyltransferase [Paenibacillus apiarius]MCY9518294.1 GNAT family N-acetyltransferase [Paenibacillus apiarius]MCY9551305.1 GNAT family N-acetyltransferase [Paenibacillus apiarius]MCY9558459.1 GNAT family N-acetyltransferase [Paenibacillus apiarius]MCY9684227.1 GNAT family N-acetyltransferase [Paenibacillus apiarius]